VEKRWQSGDADCRRLRALTCVLAIVVVYLTVVCKWRPNAWETCIVIVVLCAVLGSLMNVSPSSLTSLITEGFNTAAADGSEGITAALQDLAGLPKSMATSIMTSLDSLADAFKGKEAKPDTSAAEDEQGGASSSSTHIVELTEKLYAGDPTLTKNDGSGGVDTAKFKKMAGEYAALQYLMCSLKPVDPELYTSVFRSILKRDPTPDPQRPAPPPQTPTQPET
jgi:hypothetical protein